MVRVNGVDINVNPKQLGKNTRMSFAKINEVLEMPNFIEIQKNSYKWFKEEGLKEVIRDMLPITDSNGNLELSFLDYTIDEKSKYTIAECKERDTTYSASLRVTAKLYNKETGIIKSSQIYMGEFPLMTDSGTFVVNGAERVVVSQLVRSPGVYYASEKDKTGKDLFSSTIIPNRGAWIEYEMDSLDNSYVRIDKNRKIPLTTFIRSIGVSTDEDIISTFGEDILLRTTIDNKDTTKNRSEALIAMYKVLRPGEPPTVESGEKHLKDLFFDPRRYDMCRFGRYKYNKKLALSNRLAGRTLSRPLVHPVTGEVLANEGDTISTDKAFKFEQMGVKIAYVLTEAKEYYVNEIGETHIRTVEREAKIIGNGMVDINGYIDFDVEHIGINEKVSFAVLNEILNEYGKDDKDKLLEIFKERKNDLMPNNITLDDIIASISYYINLNAGVGNVDDIDHLGNRRIRSVGELLQNQFRVGFVRMERAIRERINMVPLQNRHNNNADEEEPPINSGDEELAEEPVKSKLKVTEVTAAALVNIRPLTSCIREFFGSSPLSQFMDQTNPLAELTHKRRLSALGPGGLSRDRAGFEVRDVHYTHYGRMCPIETPEGPNIGLISYLASFAKVNKYGFIEAPYRKINKETGVVTEEVVYMTADVEDLYVVAQANEPLTEDGRFAKSKVTARFRDKIFECEGSKADFMDVSPKMVVSVATACIPFLENDDANRALMGSNMQRQAVPLLRTESPIVGTGMEYKAAVDSGICILAEADGVVTAVSADEIVIQDDSYMKHVQKLIKFKRSNQGTCVNHHPIVEKGERVVKGQVIADGPSTSNGEISLGRNALIGFMTWEGYNYEDAVLLNEKVVRDDIFTSIHIEEYEVECRETKLGAEEITREIPNVSDDAKKDLDERGIIRIGAEVRSGDILVGKVTPKGETDLSAEERLLRAIFGEKAREVRDNSLRVPHGEAGVIVDVKVFTRENCDELGAGVNMLVRCYIAQKRKISVGDKMAGRHGNKGVVSRIMRQEDMPFLPDGTPLDIVLNPLGVPSRMNIGQVLEVHLGMAAKQLGWKIMTPVFDGAREEDIRACFKAAGMAEDGKTELYDGRTGEKFDNRVTVGYMYYLKLHHLVDDKIHARSVGPYSLVTQQPLGGKAQFGGQRFGEMEVWALEAYGAAYTLQEILTVKSDDTNGRVATYEAIVKGQNVPKPGVPESFKVLVKELQSLGLDMHVLDKTGNEIDLKQTYDDDILPTPTAYLDENITDTSAFDDDEYLGNGMIVRTKAEELLEEEEEVNEDEIDVEEELKKLGLIKGEGAEGTGGAGESVAEAAVEGIVAEAAGESVAETVAAAEVAENIAVTDTEVTESINAEVAVENNIVTEISEGSNNAEVSDSVAVSENIAIATGSENVIFENTPDSDEGDSDTDTDTDYSGNEDEGDSDLDTDSDVALAVETPVFSENNSFNSTSVVETPVFTENNSFNNTPIVENPVNQEEKTPEVQNTQTDEFNNNNLV
ncbi:MAG: DNA-directed RNA polymerase subunit beta [Oscillospiraceae bacterium]|jgi:DNA-directed RNA polymerase subunit beta|nr:DNA-directed RNA polymerase subunit beta [Oscillospiraceae bacterium]